MWALCVPASESASRVFSRMREFHRWMQYADWSTLLSLCLGTGRGNQQTTDTQMSKSLERNDWTIHRLDNCCFSERVTKQTNIRHIMTNITLTTVMLKLQNLFLGESISVETVIFRFQKLLHLGFRFPEHEWPIQCPMRWRLMVFGSELWIVWLLIATPPTHKMKHHNDSFQGCESNSWTWEDILGICSTLCK